MLSTFSKVTLSVLGFILTIAIAPALAAIPAECNNRIVPANDKWEPLAPGCRRLTCNPMYKVAQDDKGTYCIQQFGCGIYCKPKTQPEN